MEVFLEAVEAGVADIDAAGCTLASFFRFGFG